jgi:hypothetical protein
MPKWLARTLTSLPSRPTFTLHNSCRIGNRRWVPHSSRNLPAPPPPGQPWGLSGITALDLLLAVCCARGAASRLQCSKFPLLDDLDR